MSLGLYLHLPFCRTHCTYCAFAISTDSSLEDRYTDALIREVSASALRTGAAEVTSVYFGGGTPSRMRWDNLRRVTEAIGASSFSSSVEFSMEANPEDITAASLEQWLSLGVNRLSIGVQSFSDHELLPLGRVHDGARAREAVALAVASGVRTSLDLMAGLPGQTAQSFARTLEQGADLGAGHISLYMLDLEEGSPLKVQTERGRVVLPEDESVAATYAAAVDSLARAGFEQYEISNFSRPGQQCRHNLRYWSRGDYCGFGLGAHSLVEGRRFANSRDIRRYIECSPQAVDFVEELSPEDVQREIIFLGLRQTSGIDYAELERLRGQEGLEWIDRGLRDGWLERRGSRVAFTVNGFLLSNEFISQLF